MQLETGSTRWLHTTGSKKPKHLEESSKLKWCWRAAKLDLCAATFLQSFTPIHSSFRLFIEWYLSPSAILIIASRTLFYAYSAFLNSIERVSLSDYWLYPWTQFIVANNTSVLHLIPYKLCLYFIKSFF